MRGELAVNMLRASSYADLREKAKEEGTVCHGEYNQHNVLILKSKTAVTGFSHLRLPESRSEIFTTL